MRAAMQGLGFRYKVNRNDPSYRSGLL